MLIDRFRFGLLLAFALLLFWMAIVVAGIVTQSRAQQWGPQWQQAPGVPDQAFVPYTIDEKTHMGIISYLEELRMTARERDPLIGLFQRLEAQAQRQAAIERARKGQSAPQPPTPENGSPPQ